MNIHDYLRVARQRWLSITLATLAAIGIALALTLSATPKYESTARLFVSTSQSDSADAYQGGLFSQQRVKSYANLITGEEVSRRVADKLGLKISPRVLSEEIRATVQPDTVVLSISVTDPVAPEAQRLAQATAEVFVTYVAELETPPGKSAAPVKATIVDRATEPNSPVSPRPIRNVGLALVLGLMLGAGLALVRDSSDTRIKNDDDVDQATGNSPVLGTIHFDKSATKTPLISPLSSHNPRVESFRVLRSNLQFVNVDARNRVFVVTSAVPHEGKSTTACNLALILSEAGQSVLLIEGDLRRPKATSYLGLENTVGVTTVLIGRANVDEAIQQVKFNCDLLASGSPPPNPAELLQSEAMKNLLAEARLKYSIVLIDAPPLLPVTDAAVLAAETDGAILVIRHGTTTREQVHNSVERLESVGARLVGSIVNMAPKAKRGSSAYGYGYGYGYAPVATDHSGSAKAPKDKKPPKAKRPPKDKKPPRERRSSRAKS